MQELIEKKRQDLESKKTLARQETEKKIEEMNQLRLQKESEVANMEQEELELI